MTQWFLWLLLEASVGWILDGQPYTYNTFLNSLDLFSLLYFASFYVSPFARPKFHFWLLIENFLPFILASVAGYSLHLGNHEVVRMAWKRFLHNVCQGVLTISTICKLQSLIRF